MAKKISITEAVEQLTTAIRDSIIEKMLGGAAMVSGKSSTKQPKKRKSSGKRVSLDEEKVVAWAGDKEVTATDLKNHFGCSYITATKFLKGSSKFKAGKKKGLTIPYSVK